MVHRKSTYRLMFKNYNAEVRKNVWEENNSLRLRRREEEMSHHSIEESDSDCSCDDSNEEDEEPRRINMKHVSVQSQPEMFFETAPLAQQAQEKVLPNVPRLQFSLEESPRFVKQVVLDDGHSGDGKDQRDAHVSSATPDPVDVKMSLQEIASDRRGFGVMRSRSQEREYDLIPALTEETNIRPRSASSSKVKLVRSHRYPYTSQLSRTTKRNFQNRERKTFMPAGSGDIVRNIGDQASFNIHLDKSQVRKTALQASAHRNKEIENLIQKQKKMSMDDWRAKNNVDYVNNASIFLDGDKNIFSRSKPKESLINDHQRIRVFSNYCKHCGGHK